ncbi:MAG: hypothetical protein QXH34_03700 [Ignisphaera sp.]
MLCHSYELIEMPIDMHPRIVCYPYGEGSSCIYRIENIREMGIENIYSFGKVQIDRYHVVGKGHAAIIVLARHRVHGTVALKIRRMDSKRASLRDEAKLLEAIHGYAPRVYLYSDDFIVREYVDGPTIEEFLKAIRSRNDVATLIKSLLLATYTLDQLNIDVGELSRPYRQVVLLCGDPSKPYFIDLESGRLYLKPSNVTRIINFVLFGCVKGSRIRDVLGLDEYRVSLLIELARRYKYSSHASREDILNRVFSIVGDY